MKAYILKLVEGEIVGIVVGDLEQVNSRLEILNQAGEEEFTIEEYELLNEEGYETFQRIRNLIDSGKFEYYCPDCGQLRLSVHEPTQFRCGNCDKPNIIKGEPGTLNKEALDKRFGNLH